MKPEIMRCYELHLNRASDLEMATTIFTDFGKGLIKKGKCSPDAFIQMALQLANYKVKKLSFTANYILDKCIELTYFRIKENSY